MLFDPRTLAAVAGLFYFLLTFLGVVVRRKHITYPGFGRWTTANALTGIGMIVTVFKPATTSWSNVVFVGAWILGVEGNRAFRGLKPRLWWLYPIGALAVTVAGYADYVRNANVRNISIGLCYALTAAVSAAALLPNPPKGRELGLRFTGSLYLLFAALNIARIIYFFSVPTITMDSRTSDIFLPSPPSTAYHLLGVWLVLSCSIGWLVMSYERALVEMKEEERRARSLAARAAEANRAKIDFLAMMGHEIRNPLSAVLNLTDLVLESELTAEQREYELGVRASIQDTLRVTEDVLDLSKIESGELTIDARPFDLVDLVERIGRVFHATVTRKGVDLVIDCPNDLPRDFVGDSGRIRQVITNLLSNAVKFTKQGYIRMTVDRQYRTSTAEMRIRVSVNDTGIGIPTHMIGTVFERFGRAHGLTSGKYGGNGLGLQISKRLIEIMGGRLAVQSDVGKGSTFWFELDLPIAPRANAAGRG
jgi:signal transduction histidine kinase